MPSSPNRVRVELPRPLHEALTAIAARDGIPVNSLVATAVRAWLAQQGEARPRRAPPSEAAAE